MDLHNKARSLDVQSLSRALGREEDQMNNLASQHPSKLLVAWDMNSREMRRNRTAAPPDTGPKTSDIHQGITGTPSRKTNQTSRRSLGSNTVVPYKSARESEDLEDPINNIPDNHLCRFDRMNRPGQDQTRSLSKCSVASTLASSKRLTGRAGTLHSPRLSKVCKGW